MNMTTIYKEDYSEYGWNYILKDFELPADTDEICVKHVSHITETMRQEKKDAQNADSNSNSA